jgi:hypothetical protein
LQVLKGRHLRVDLAGGSETTKDSSLSVFVGNLPFTVSEEQVGVEPLATKRCARHRVFVSQLRALFASKVDDGDDCITNVRIVRDKVTNKAKGVAYVAFKVGWTAKSCACCRGGARASLPFQERINVFQALALHDTEFAGRTIRVSHCKSEARLGRGHPGGFQGLQKKKLAAQNRLKTSKHQKNRKEDRARKAKKRERKANKLQKKASKAPGVNNKVSSKK